MDYASRILITSRSSTPSRVQHYGRNHAWNKAFSSCKKPKMVTCPISQSQCMSWAKLHYNTVPNYSESQPNYIPQNQINIEYTRWWPCFPTPEFQRNCLIFILNVLFCSYLINNLVFPELQDQIQLGFFSWSCWSWDITIPLKHNDSLGSSKILAKKTKPDSPGR